MGEDGDPVAVNNTTVAMASQLERPIGSKKAKMMKDEENSFTDLLLKQQHNITALAVSNENLASALEKKNEMKNRQMNLNNFWKKLEFYDKRGNEQKVQELMEEINALDQQMEE